MTPFEGVLVRPFLTEIYRGQTARLSPAEFRLASLLLLSRGGTRSMFDLIDMLYGDDADGGPLGASGTVRVMVYFANRKLAPLGIRLLGRPGRGSVYRAVDLWATSNSQPQKSSH